MTLIERLKALSGGEDCLVRLALVEIESLRQQLAAMTAERDKLLHVMCEISGSKSLTATPTQFYQYLQRMASDATITNKDGLANGDQLKEQGRKQSELLAATEPKP